MKINLISEDNLPLKILKIRMLTIIIKPVFQEDNKYYSQVFSDKGL